MYDQVKTNCPPPPPSKANPFPIFIAAVLASALPLVYSTAKAQGPSQLLEPAKAQEPGQFKRFQISMMSGVGQLDTNPDFVGFGLTDDVSPISLGYGFNITERYGIWVQLTPSTEVEKELGGTLEISYESTQIFYKVAIPEEKEYIKSYGMVGLSHLTWNYELAPGYRFVNSEDGSVAIVEDGSGLGLAFGMGTDFFVLPEFSLRISLIADFVPEAGNVDINTLVLFFGASFHF